MKNLQTVFCRKIAIIPQLNLYFRRFPRRSFREQIYNSDVFLVAHLVSRFIIPSISSSLIPPSARYRFAPST